MGAFWLLATAEVPEKAGFALNTNILDTNLINLIIIIGLLVYFSRDLVSSILVQRRSQIETTIREAEQSHQEAKANLETQQQQLAQVQSQAEQIRSTGVERAQGLKEAILAQTEVEIARLRVTADQETSSEQERIEAELRQRIATLAIAKVAAQLREQLTEADQRALIDRNIALLGGP